MPKQITKETKKEKKSEKTVKRPTFYQAVGRRKESTAIVRLYVISQGSINIEGKEIKKGAMIVNKRPIEEYFPGEIYKKICLEPYRTSNTIGRFAVSAVILGGGKVSQMNAFIHGSARALEKVDREKFRPLLKKRGFLTRDARIKQRRKAGYAQKARAKKQSPKR